MAQAEWWIPQHGCDSLENTLDAIKGRLLVAVQDWWATALVPTTPAAPERGEAGLEASFRAWYQHAYGSAYFGAMPLCVAIEWAQHLLSQPTAPAPVVVPVGQGDAIARQAYVAFVQICKGRSDDAGTYEEDEALVRRALKRLDKLESDHAIPLPQGGEGE